MDYLIRFGFSIDDIKNMMDTNIYIGNVSDSMIKQLITLLEKCSCSREQIRDILLCNPFYLSQGINNVKEIIEFLKKFGFKNLNQLFSLNPYLLNLGYSEILVVIDDLKKKNLNEKEIIDYFNYNLII